MCMEVTQGKRAMYSHVHMVFLKRSAGFHTADWRRKAASPAIQGSSCVLGAFKEVDIHTLSSFQSYRIWFHNCCCVSSCSFSTETINAIRNSKYILLHKTVQSKVRYNHGTHTDLSGGWGGGCNTNLS